jgi:hypothetical protein
MHGYASCWRRLNFWRKRGQLKLVWQHILVILDREGKLDLSLGNLDGTLVQAPKYQGVGYDSQHHRYGTNISLLTERNGLPLTDMTTKGNRNDIVCAEATMHKLRVGAKRRVTELKLTKDMTVKRFDDTSEPEVLARTSRSVKLSTDGSEAASHTWINSSSSSGPLSNEPMPG